MRQAAWSYAISACFVSALLVGCKDDRSKSSTASNSDVAKVRLTLDWKPEPEFGGFYAAKRNGAFERNKLDVDIKPAGPGAPTWQLVARGQTDFATTAADQVLIAREQGADVVAIFAVYQTCPQAVMAHKARGFTKLQDVFANEGTLAAEDNAWLRYCRDKFQPVKATITGYSGGVAAFLAKADYSQQCFVFSEPILARKQDPNADPQTFLVAESGYNPYTTVVITSRAFINTHHGQIDPMIKACQEGWRAYLDNPTETNKLMATLNPDMDLDTFAQAAAAQKSLIETEETKKLGLGVITKDRWDTLGQQLVMLKVIKKAASSDEAVHNLGDPW